MHTKESRWRSYYRQRCKALERPVGVIEYFTYEELLRAMFCASCTAYLKRTPHRLSHLVPIAYGGDHTKANCVLMCERCSSRPRAFIETPEGDTNA